MKVNVNKGLRGLSFKQRANITTSVELPFMPFVGLRLMILGNWEEVAIIWWTGEELIVSVKENDDAYWGGKYSGEDLLSHVIAKYLELGWTLIEKTEK